MQRHESAKKKLVVKVRRRLPQLGPWPTNNVPNVHFVKQCSQKVGMAIMTPCHSQALAAIKCFSQRERELKEKGGKEKGE
jgi:hypothetical protein